MGPQLKFVLNYGEFATWRLNEKMQVAQGNPCIVFRNVSGVSDRKPSSFRHGWIQGLNVSKVPSSSISWVGSALGTLPGLHLAPQPHWTEHTCPLGPPSGSSKAALVGLTWGHEHLSMSRRGLGDAKL